MKDQGVGRREFLKGAAVAGAASVASAPAILPEPAQAQQAAAAAPTAAGYSFLNLEEAAFVETLVDHMVPADELSPKGTDIGINTYIDRALSSAWGKGDRLYMQGPWKVGVPSQGYQLPLTPGPALSRRHRGDQRLLPQDLWRPHLRPPDRSAARRSAARSLLRPRSTSPAGSPCARSGPRSIRA